MTILETIRDMVDEKATAAKKVAEGVYQFRDRNRVVMYWDKLQETALDNLEAITEWRQRQQLPAFTVTPEMKAAQYAECLKDARKLRGSKFAPELDNIEEQDIYSIFMKVIIEHDLMIEGELDAYGLTKEFKKAKSKQVRAFFAAWRYQLPAKQQQYFIV